MKTYTNLLLGAVLSTLLLSCGKPPHTEPSTPPKSAAEASRVLEQALTLDKKTDSNALDGSEVVSNLSKSGFFAGEASLRMDYSSYYMPKKPILLLGQRVVYFDYEYMEQYVGCCVNAGNAVVLLMESDTTSVENFAERNICRVRKGRQIYLNEHLLNLLNLDAEQISLLVEVSCKEDYRNDQKLKASNN